MEEVGQPVIVREVPWAWQLNGRRTRAEICLDSVGDGRIGNGHAVADGDVVEAFRPWPARWWPPPTWHIVVGDVGKLGSTLLLLRFSDLVVRLVDFDFISSALMFWQFGRGHGRKWRRLARDGLWLATNAVRDGNWK
ncbi:hypothetical protein Dimus_001035 [Dionaea muscipula]